MAAFPLRWVPLPLVETVPHSHTLVSEQSLPNQASINGGNPIRNVNDSHHEDPDREQHDSQPSHAPHPLTTTEHVFTTDISFLSKHTKGASEHRCSPSNVGALAPRPSTLSVSCPLPRPVVPCYPIQ